MGSCTRRHFMLSTCFLQMITIIERQIFDFLGYMWAPIIVNFFQIIFVIFGFYGAYHLRVKYIITYFLWSFLCIGWNTFLICFYLNVGVLDRDSDFLNLGTGSVSWFEVNGYRCVPIYPTNITSEDPYRPLRPEHVDNCLVDYTVVEVIHSGVQCILAFVGIIGAIFISYIFIDEDDRFDFMNGDAKNPQHTVVHPTYVRYSSIPTSANATMLSNWHHQNQIVPNYLQQKKSFSNTSFRNQTRKLTYNESSTITHNNSNSNSNTFLIHTNNNNSGTNSINNKRILNNKNNYHESSYKSNRHHIANDMQSRILSHMFHRTNKNKISSSINFTLPLESQPSPEPHNFCDESTDQADQLYTHRSRRQIYDRVGEPYKQRDIPYTPEIRYDSTQNYNTYISLHNSFINLVSFNIGVNISNSNFSLTGHSCDNNNITRNGPNERKNTKSCTSQTTSSYKSSNTTFIESEGNCTTVFGSNSYFPEIICTQVSNSASFHSPSTQNAFYIAQPSKSSINFALGNIDFAHHVNRRTGRGLGSVRPRSYCNSFLRGDAAIREHIATDTDKNTGNT